MGVYVCIYIYAIYEGLRIFIGDMFLIYGQVVVLLQDCWWIEIQVVVALFLVNLSDVHMIWLLLIKV
jgi:hypothetical protein